LNDLSSEARFEIIEAINLTIEGLKAIIKAEGFNSGINIGPTGGGGIPQHIHFHILPRWRGDTSFLTVIGETSVISSDLMDIYNELRTFFAEATLKL